MCSPQCPVKPLNNVNESHFMSIGVKLTIHKTLTSIRVFFVLFLNHSQHISLHISISYRTQVEDNVVKNYE